MTQRQSQVKVLSMQKFAKLCETTPRTIRFYQQVGLIQPVHVDPFTKYRYFDPLQAREVFRIKLLQNFHIPLKDIKELLASGKADLFLKEKLHLVGEEIEEKQKELAFLQEIQQFVVEENPISSQLQEELVGPYTLLCVFVEHGRYDSINSYVERVYKTALEAGIEATEDNITFYHDPYRYRPNDSALEVGIICKKIPENVVLSNGLYVKKFHRQKVLVYNYKGPFEYLTFIHKRMVELTKGKKLNGFPFDLTLSGPWNAKSKYDYLTKVGYPLEFDK